MSEEGEFKICVRCKIGQPKTQFFKDAKAKDGLASWCKDCRIKYLTKWRDNHRQQYRKLMLDWYYNNRDKRAAYQRLYRLDKEKLIAHEFRKHHPDMLPLWGNCETCGTTKVLIRHHPDYLIPDLYVTLCRQCHWWVHYG